MAGYDQLENKAARPWVVHATAQNSNACSPSVQRRSEGRFWTRKRRQQPHKAHDPSFVSRKQETEQLLGGGVFGTGRGFASRLLCSCSLGNNRVQPANPLELLPKPLRNNGNNSKSISPVNSVQGGAYQNASDPSRLVRKMESRSCLLATRTQREATKDPIDSGICLQLVTKVASTHRYLCLTDASATATGGNAKKGTLQQKSTNDLLCTILWHKRYWIKDKRIKKNRWRIEVSYWLSALDKVY